MDWAIVDRDGRTLSAADEHAARGESILTRIPEAMQGAFLCLLREALTDGRRRQLSVPAGRDSTPIDIRPLRLPGGGDPAAMVVFAGAAAEYGSLVELRRLARRNEAILRSSMDGFFVVDRDCRFLEANEAFARMLGYTPAELLTMRITDLEAPDARESGAALHTQTGMHHFPTLHRHKAGHLVQLELSVNVLYDSGEKVLVGFARDVTERRRVEAELARLTRQRTLILDSAADGIVGLDAEGSLTFMNPAAARLLGVAAGAALGQSAHGLLLGRPAGAGACGAAACPLCAVLRGGASTFNGESRLLRGDGAPLPVELSARAIRDGLTTSGAVLVFRDISERLRLEQERRAYEAKVQQVQRLESLGMLAGGMAHDLNNIMVGILGNACLGLSQAGDEARVRECLQRVVRACERAARVIRQVLTYSGRVESEVAPLDLNELLRELLEFMRVGVDPRIRLDAALDAPPLVVEGDSGHLQQVFTNLVVNAIEAIGPGGGRVGVTTGRCALDDGGIQCDFAGQALRAGDYAWLRVEDDGCGMNEETLARLFEPFFSRKGLGRGLGLSAMRGILRAHRGGVRVESAPGAGAAFTVVLPLSDRPLRPLADAPPLRAAGPARTVLVIDDEADVREVVQDMLTARGFRVLEAADGSQGVEQFRRHADEIDVVVLDMAMPGKSGAEVFHELIAIRPDARVIVSSGYSEQSMSARFPGTRPRAFVGKPFTLDALVDKIGLALRADASMPLV